MGSGFRTFQSGEVLTSSNVQNYLMDQSVMVFAGTAARGSAIASPETGMVSYRTDGTADSKREGFEFYDGTNWTRLVPAPTSTGLVVVKAETAFSNVASVTADGIFTSTYTNYRMIVRYQVTSGLISFQLRAATVDAATNYNIQSLTAGSTTVAGARSTSQTSATIGNNSGGAFWSLAVVDITGPQLAEPTIYESHSVRNDGNYTTGLSIAQYYGNHSDSTAYDGIKILGTAANITGSYTIYGYGETL